MKSKLLFSRNKQKTSKTTKFHPIYSSWNSTPKTPAEQLHCFTLSWMHFKNILIWSNKTLIYRSFTSKLRVKHLSKLEKCLRKTKTFKKTTKTQSRKDRLKFNKKCKHILLLSFKKMGFCTKWTAPKSSQSAMDKQLRIVWWWWLHLLFNSSWQGTLRTPNLHFWQSAGLPFEFYCKDYFKNYIWLIDGFIDLNLSWRETRM